MLVFKIPIAPIAPLCLGNASSTCDGYLVFEKNNGSGLNRMFRLGLNSGSDFQIGDYGYSNIFAMSWAAPANSFYLNQYGNIVLGNALSVAGGYGKITIDYPSVAGGRLTLDDNGNLNLPRGTLSVAGATTLSSSLTVTGATTLNSSLTVNGATTLNSSLTLNGSVQGNQFFCINSSATFMANWHSTGNVGCFIGTNQWWNNGVSGGFCYLHVCIEMVVNNTGGNIGVWMGKTALHGLGGVLGFYADYTYNGGDYGTLFIVNQWDTGGNNAIRIYNAGLTSYGGYVNYKIYG